MIPKVFRFRSYRQKGINVESYVLFAFGLLLGIVALCIKKIGSVYIVFAKFDRGNCALEIFHSGL